MAQTAQPDEVTRLRKQVAALQEQVVRLQAEIDRRRRSQGTPQPLPVGPGGIHGDVNPIALKVR